MANSGSFSLDERYLCQDGTIYLTGVQALVRMLLDRARHDRAQGLRIAGYVSGYEGSPLAGYDLELQRQRRLLDEFQILHQPGLNEELAATAVSGSQLSAVAGTASYDGVVGVWYGKGPGLDRAGDALRHANLIGADPRGGALVLVGDDPAAKSSTIPSASESSLAAFGMLYGLHYAVFVEHQTLGQLGGSLTQAFQHAAERHPAQSKAALDAYGETKYDYVRQVDGHSHWIGLAMLMIVLGVLFERVNLSEGIRQAIALALLVGSAAFPLAVILQTYHHGAMALKGLTVASSGLVITALAATAWGFSRPRTTA